MLRDRTSPTPPGLETNNPSLHETQRGQELAFRDGL
jgi:hypothetical protein